MKNKVFLFIIIAFVSINLFSESNVVMPLEIGNSWTYIYSAGPEFNGKFTMVVSEIIEVNDNEVYKLDFTGDLYNEDYWQLLQNNDSKLYFYGHLLHGELKTPDLWLDMEAEVGQTWETNGMGAVVEWEVISLSETITVAAGTFECIHIQGKTTGYNTAVDHWWAIGVGEIKAYVEMADLEWELSEFEIK